MRTKNPLLRDSNTANVAVAILETCRQLRRWLVQTSSIMILAWRCLLKRIAWTIQWPMVMASESLLLVGSSVGVRMDDRLVVPATYGIVAASASARPTEASARAIFAKRRLSSDAFSKRFVRSIEAFVRDHSKVLGK